MSGALAAKTFLWLRTSKMRLGEASISPSSELKCQLSRCFARPGRRHSAFPPEQKTVRRVHCITANHKPVCIDQRGQIFASKHETQMHKLLYTASVNIQQHSATFSNIQCAECVSSAAIYVMYYLGRLGRHSKHLYYGIEALLMACTRCLVVCI